MLYNIVMKNKHFYGHLTETTDITLEIAGMDLSPDERVHLMSLLEANIHSAVVNTVLTELNKDDKKIFLKNLVLEDHEETWRHLKSKKGDIEEKVKKTIQNMVKELSEDIKKTKPKTKP